MKTNPLLLGGILFAFACQNDTQAQRCAHAKNMMTIHDAVMPKMGAPPPDSGFTREKNSALKSIEETHNFLKQQ